MQKMSWEGHSLPLKSTGGSNMVKLTKKTVAGLSVFVLVAGVLSGCNLNPTESKKTENQAGEIAKQEKSEFTQFANQVHQKITDHWPSMNKVWPTYDYTNHNLILFLLNDSDVEEAVLINTKEQRKLTADEYKAIQAPQDDGYDAVEFNGKPSLAMSVTQQSMQKKKAVDTLYRVATHEIVHFYYQGEALLSQNSESRAQDFPLDKTPRLYRQMIYQNLIKAYDAPSDDVNYLGKAKYWLEKWKNEYSSEYESIKSTDIAEATARYSENLGTFIDPKIEAKEIYKSAAKDIKRTETFYSADGESYEIGYVAALLLDRRQPDWKKDFYASKSTIEEVLLKDVQSVDDEMDQAVETRVSAELDKYNNETLTSIQNIIDARKDKSIPYLKIDVTNSTSSMSAAGVVSVDGVEITIEYGNLFKANGKVIEIDKLNIFEQVDEAGNQFVYVPLQMPFEVKDDTLLINSERLKVEHVNVSKTDEEGRTVYFVKVDE